MKQLLFIIFSALSLFCSANPIDSLAYRVTEGTSEGKIIFNEVPSETDFFEIKALNNKVLIEGNNAVSMATGLNWYLKYVAGIHISWNNLTQKLPETLPLPQTTIRKQSNAKHRYYLNYCTFSYSMPFWDEDRWMKEIDWMALHGINMPLSITGIETVWRNLLRKLGYSDKEIGEFICGPAFFAWWQMNNLEGWGGPLPAEWYENQENLQKNILNRMHSLGITPVLPGYAGMAPRNIGEKFGYKVDDPGTWCGFNRPAFLSPFDEHFDEFADLYYEELKKLYGSASFYSMDPFHEGGSTKGVDLAAAGTKLMDAMKRTNPNAKWVIQSWQRNPMPEMTDTLNAGDLIVLDLYSEKIPKWKQNGGYGKHDWVYCMLLNFGGNVGLHGRINALVNGYYEALSGEAGQHLTGVGATPEGIENNPVMYELVFELPWRNEKFDINNWIHNYTRARYALDSVPAEINEAWQTLTSTVYNAPVNYTGDGTVESVFCARPRWNVKSASSWGSSKLFYDADSTSKAANLLNQFNGNHNFQYDVLDVRRQANADRGNKLLQKMATLKDAGKTDSLVVLSKEFLNLILTQDSLLSQLPYMHVDTWLNAAGNLAGNNPEALELYRRNAAQQITVWGDSVAANRGGLHDYSHREWGGILRELYHKRWEAFFNHELHGAPAPDYYKMECDWVDRRSKQ